MTARANTTVARRQGIQRDLRVTSQCSRETSHVRVRPAVPIVVCRGFATGFSSRLDFLAFAQICKPRHRRVAGPVKVALDRRIDLLWMYSMYLNETECRCSNSWRQEVTMKWFVLGASEVRPAATRSFDRAQYASSPASILVPT